MSETVFNGSISAHNAIAAPQATQGGTINISFGGQDRPLASSLPAQPFSNVPFPRDPGFVERTDILDRLRALTDRNGSRAALVGLGGNG